MTKLLTSTRKSELRHEYVSFDWARASKASICAFMLAFAPLSGALAQNNDNADNGQAAPVAPAAPASDEDSGNADSAETTPAAAAPAAPAAASDEGNSEDSATASAAATPAAATAEPSSANANANAAASQTTNLGNMTVTGTALSRTDTETSLQVSSYDADELRDQGVTSTPQLMQRVVGNDTSSGPGLSTGAQVTGGASFADLRGLGPNKTLILLNGRRLAVNGLQGNGTATDLNSIPFSAIKRVEVLRSGASALYGTDAVGGVINFITKKDIQGGNLSLKESVPTRDGGGNQTTLSATFGKGDFQKDGWNIMGTLEYRRQEPVSANDRSFVTPLDPRINAVSGFTYPGQYVQNGDYNATAPGCGVHGEVPFNDTQCRENYTALGAKVVNKSNEPSAYVRGAYKFNDKNKASLSYLWTRNENYVVSAPSPSVGPENLGIPIHPSSPYYPGKNGIPTPDDFSEGDDALLRWRAAPLGPRVTRNVNQTQRAVLNFTGRFLDGFHYDTAFSFNQSTTKQHYVRGYFNQNVGDNSFLHAVNNGDYNPFDSNPSQQQRDYLQGLQTTGLGAKYRTRAYVWDGKLDHDVGNWFGSGQSQLALGSQYRHETLEEFVDDGIARRAPSTGVTGVQTNQDRDVESVYGELNVPLLETLSVDAQARYDNYSDVGDTLNPKISMRYQPVDQLLLRAHYSEGFHAPTLYDLYQPAVRTNTSGGLNDPVRCPGGSPISGASDALDCDKQFTSRQGGNSDLSPEKSESWGAGFVLQPIKYLSMSVDFWHIRLKDIVGVPPDSYLFSNYDQYSDRFHRGSSDNGPGPIRYVEDGNENLGAITTSGEDINVNFKLPTNTGTYTLTVNGTYTNSFRQQNVPGAEFVKNVGVFANDSVIFDWRHNITLGWSKGPWGFGVVNHYKTGYKDSGGDRDVDDYMTWDMYGSYAFKSGLKITLGSQNISDEDPPFSVQQYAGNSGYDARYASGLGRTVYGQLSYDF